MNRPSVLTLFMFLILLQGVLSIVKAESDVQSKEVILKAIQNHGGKENWDQKGTLIVHESQSRYTDDGIVPVKLVHYMDTKGRGYRLEINTDQTNHVYGWDGHEFWAVSSEQQDQAVLLREAERVVKNSFYRFSLPFILDDPDANFTYQGTEKIDQIDTEVVKITYQASPGSRYWATSATSAVSGHGSGHGQSRHQSNHNTDAGNHQSANEVYYYHFASDDYRIVKIYFSHHGDDNYETLLFDDYRNIEGIPREHERKLIRANDQVNYDAVFTKIEFQPDLGQDFFKAADR